MSIPGTDAPARSPENETPRERYYRIRREIRQLASISDLLGISPYGPEDKLEGKHD